MLYHEILNQVHCISQKWESVLQPIKSFRRTPAELGLGLPAVVCLIPINPGSTDPQRIKEVTKAEPATPLPKIDYKSPPLHSHVSCTALSKWGILRGTQVEGFSDLKWSPIPF